MRDVLNELRPRVERLTRERSVEMLNAVLSHQPPVRRRGRNSVLVVATVLAIAASMLGFGLIIGNDEQESPVTADCTPMIRVDDIVYELRRYEEVNSATPLGQAQLSECEDTRRRSRGSYFPDDPRQKNAWSFEGTNPDRVLGIRQAGGIFSVYIATDATDNEIQRILHELKRSRTPR